MQPEHGGTGAAGSDKGGSVGADLAYVAVNESETCDSHTVLRVLREAEG